MPIDDAAPMIMSPDEPKRPFDFKSARLHVAPDIRLYSANLAALREHQDGRSGFDYLSPSNNRIVLRGKSDLESLKNTTIYFSGVGNTVIVEELTNVRRLEIACIGGASVTLGAPQVMRGVTVLSAHGCNVEIGPDCMMSRDVLIYASGAHALYNVHDGKRRYKDRVTIGSHVWLGQGTRILAGAEVGDGSVIGSYSVLAGRVPNNCAAAGNPCRVTARDVFWTAAADVGEGGYYQMLDRSGRKKPAFINHTEADR